MSTRIIDKRHLSIQLILAIMFACFIFSLALFLVLSQTGMYPFLSRPVHNFYNLDEAVIEGNYRHLISYNLNPLNDQLTFQGLPISKTGLIHFHEVKRIFWTIFIAGFLCGLISISSGVYYFHHRLVLHFLKYAFRISLLLTAITILFILFKFDQAFTTFHEILFSNDFWVFDSNQDGIILYLPIHFFRRIALLILVTWLSLLFIMRTLVYLLLKRKIESPIRNCDGK